jgi:hypothetical protein
MSDTVYARLTVIAMETTASRFSLQDAGPFLYWAHARQLPQLPFSRASVPCQAQWRASETTRKPTHERLRLDGQRHRRVVPVAMVWAHVVIDTAAQEWSRRFYRTGLP